MAALAAATSVSNGLDAGAAADGFEVGEAGRAEAAASGLTTTNASAINNGTMKFLLFIMHPPVGRLLRLRSPFSLARFRASQCQVAAPFKNGLRGGCLSRIG